MTNKILTSFPLLTTGRLTLRQLKITDDNEILALRSNESVNKYLGRHPSKSLEDARSFIQTIIENFKKNDSIYWAISLSGKMVGTICLFEFADGNNIAGIGFELLPVYQKNGLMQEAASKVLEFGFEHLGLNSIKASTHCENRNSIRLLEKLNFIKQASSGDTFHKMLLFLRIDKSPNVII